jgi:uncharacterized radical SAM superfamily Fe-S cluster-containing enzyme
MSEIEEDVAIIEELDAKFHEIEAKPKRSHHKKKPVAVEKRHKMGRPPKSDRIDFAQIEELAANMLTKRQIAAVIGVSYEYITREPLASLVNDAMARGYDQVASKITNKQFELAMKGSEKMLTLLGAQYCGQSEKLDIRSKQEAVVVHIEIPFEDKDL